MYALRVLISLIIAVLMVFSVGQYHAAAQMNVSVMPYLVAIGIISVGIYIIWPRRIRH